MQWNLLDYWMTINKYTCPVNFLALYNINEPIDFPFDIVSCLNDPLEKEEN